mgnify:CR=1 FL=1
MALSNKQREEMRSEIIGPCSKKEKTECRNLLKKQKEPLESLEYWKLFDTPDSDEFRQIAFDPENASWTKTGCDVFGISTITFAEFKSKYFSNATK